MRASSSLLRFAEPVRHAVELVREFLQFVVGVELHARVQLSLAETHGAFAEGVDRPTQLARQRQGRDDRQHDAKGEQGQRPLGSPDQRSEGLLHGLLDEHMPAEGWNCLLRRQRELALAADRLPPDRGSGLQRRRRLHRGENLRSLGKAGLAQDQLHVPVRYQLTGGIDHVGIARRSNLQPGQELANQFQIDLRHQDLAPASVFTVTERQCHVGLAVATEADRACIVPIASRCDDGRIFAQVAAWLGLVDVGTRDFGRLPSVRIHPGRFADGRRLSQQAYQLATERLRVLDRGDVAEAQGRARQRFDLAHELFDPLGGDLQFLALRVLEQRAQLDVREVKGDRTADDENSADEAREVDAVAAEQRPSCRQLARRRLRHDNPFTRSSSPCPLEAEARTRSSRRSPAPSED